jgi:hypothetical protein
VDSFLLNVGRTAGWQRQKIFNLPDKSTGISFVLAMEFASSVHQGNASYKRADDSYLTIKFVEVWQHELSR